VKSEYTRCGNTGSKHFFNPLTSMDDSSMERPLLTTSSDGNQSQTVGNSSKPVSFYLQRYKLESNEDDLFLVVRFFRNILFLLSLQLIYTVVLTGLLKFTSVAQIFQRINADQCSESFVHLSCPEIFVNLLLFFVLLPLIFKIGAVPGWNICLYVVWSLAIGFDIVLLLSELQIATSGFYCLAVLLVTVLSILVCLYIRNLLATSSCLLTSLFSSSLCIILGGIVHLFESSIQVWYSIGVAIILVNLLIVEIKFISKRVQPSEFILGALFLLFPEGLGCLARREATDSTIIIEP